MVPVALQNATLESSTVSSADEPTGFSPDREVNRRLAHGDASALQELMNSYWAPLLQYAQGILGERQDGEDVVQEAFVRLWNTRASRPPAASAAAFLYRVVRNLALNQKRDVRTRIRLAIGGLAGTRSTPSTPAEECDATELAAAARLAIRQLPDRRREIFVLARSHGLSYREIADVMSISPQTVANQMSRALVDLRSQLAPYLV